MTCAILNPFKFIIWRTNFGVAPVNSYKSYNHYKSGRSRERKGETDSYCLDRLVVGLHGQKRGEDHASIEAEACWIEHIVSRYYYSLLVGLHLQLMTLLHCSSLLCSSLATWSISPAKMSRSCLSGESGL